MGDYLKACECPPNAAKRCRLGHIECHAALEAFVHPPCPGCAERDQRLATSEAGAAALRKAIGFYSTRDDGGSLALRVLREHDAGAALLARVGELDALVCESLENSESLRKDYAPGLVSDGWVQRARAALSGADAGHRVEIERTISGTPCIVEIFETTDGKPTDVEPLPDVSASEMMAQFDDDDQAEDAGRAGADDEDDLMCDHCPHGWHAPQACADPGCTCRSLAPGRAGAEEERKRKEGENHIQVRDAGNDLIDAIAWPAGRDFAHAWANACLFFGRFGATPALFDTLAAQLAEAKRECEGESAFAKELGQVLGRITRAVGLDFPNRDQLVEHCANMRAALAERTRELEEALSDNAMKLARAKAYRERDAMREALDAERAKVANRNSAIATAAGEYKRVSEENADLRAKLATATGALETLRKMEHCSMCATEICSRHQDPVVYIDAALAQIRSTT